MSTNVTIIPQKRQTSYITLVKVEETYMAMGYDALLVSHCLKIPFYTKKIKGKALHSTSFNSGEFSKFEAKLLGAGYQLSVSG